MDNTSASQEDIDAARSELEAAIQGLVKKEETPDVDTSTLSATLSNAQSYLDTSKYNADKVAALQTAIDNANSVLANTKSTQSEIDAASAAVAKAVQDCINSPVDNTQTPPETNTPNQGDNSGNGTTGG